jgi:GTP cyclohydrolase II
MREVANSVSIQRCLFEATLRQVARSTLPTKWGEFRMFGFERELQDISQPLETAVALLSGDVTQGHPLVRIHSQCITSEAFGSLRCDCKDQLDLAMRMIAVEGGLLIYEYQEGRGIGLMSKLKTYALQDMGLDTIEANHALGFRADCRDFALAVAILHELGIRSVRLLSNNPQKSSALRKGRIQIVEELPCESAPHSDAMAYLRTKKERMGHTLTLV